MRTLLAVLFKFLGLGVLLFIAGAFWGASFVGAPSGDLMGTLATGGTHAWIATMLMSLGTGAFACAPFVALLAWLRSRQSKGLSENSSRFPGDADGRVLNQLVTAGSDLTKAHQPEFFFYFPAETTAKRVATLIEADGFQVTVRHAADGDKWLCLATKTMLLTHEGMTAIRTRFDALADESDGEYDGWGTPVID